MTLTVLMSSTDLVAGAATKGLKGAKQGGADAASTARRALKGDDVYLNAIKSYKEDNNCGLDICGQEFDFDIKLTRDYVCAAGNGPKLVNRAKLDCDGHSITGPGFLVNNQATYGVRTEGDSGTAEITNCVVSNFGIGIALDATSKVKNTHVHGTRAGIDLRACGVELEDVVVTENDDSGITNYAYECSLPVGLKDVFSCDNNARDFRIDQFGGPSLKLEGEITCDFSRGDEPVPCTSACECSALDL